MNEAEVQHRLNIGFELGRVERKDIRGTIPGFVGDIADGLAIFGGKVEDISTSGFKLTNVPESFTAQKHIYTTVVSGNGKHYRLLAKPCWKKPSELDGFVEVGFKIIDAPWEWTELALDIVTDFDRGDDFSFNA